MPLSLNRHDRKLLGVCSTFGEVFRIDPTFMRVGLVAFGWFVSWKIMAVIYGVGWLYLRAAQRDALRRHSRVEGDGFWGAPRRTSIKEMRDTFDTNDRRMMAIDHHLHRRNDSLAREIEELRGE